MSSFEALKFFATAPHPCSYLEDEEATTVFVEPSTDLSVAQIVKLAESGFRRSGRYTYRPQCTNCTACISVRVPVDSFKPRRRQIRTFKRNQDVSFSARTPILDEERYSLYKRYMKHGMLMVICIRPPLRSISHFSHPTERMLFSRARINEPDRCNTIR